MADERGSKELQTHLAEAASNRRTNRQELVFDPHTGQLRVSNEPSVDAVAVDSINRDGFFVPPE
jgi:hypothetical protein